VPDVAAV
jgi:hypothetical protein